MPSAGGQVPTQTRRARLGERLGDGEAEPAVVGDARDERALAREIDRATWCGDTHQPRKGSRVKAPRFSALANDCHHEAYGAPWANSRPPSSWPGRSSVRSSPRSSAAPGPRGLQRAATRPTACRRSATRSGEQMPRLGGCIACGLCDVGEGAAIVRSAGAYAGAMDLMLASSRSMPDYDAAARSFEAVGDDRLAELEGALSRPRAHARRRGVRSHEGRPRWRCRRVPKR